MASETGTDVRGPAATPFPPILDARPTPSVAQPSAFHPDDDPACADLKPLTAAIRLWRTVANPQPHRREALALWPTLPPACRGGTFFVAAAELVGLADDAALSSVDGAIVIHSPGDALARGLAVEPDHPRLLAHVALVEDLASDIHVPLPLDACQRAKSRGDSWTDYAAYICVLAAIHAGEGPTALTELERIRSVAQFPDLKARRVQALVLAGRRKEARSLAKPAAAALARGLPFDIPDAAIAALKKQLAAL